MSNYFSYKRISTKEDRGLQKYNRQESSLKRFAKENNIEFIAEFQEDVSGSTFTNRKEWNKLENLLQSGDTIVFKDIRAFTREADNGYTKYMSLLEKGIDLIFIDNTTVSTPYIKELLKVAKEQDLVARTTMEMLVKLMIIVELDRVEKERTILIKRIKNGIEASEKTQGRKVGQLDKMSVELKEDIINYLSNRNIKQIDIMNKHNISRNTLKKYAEIIQNKKDL